jgi:hypothetical protein
LYSSHEEKMGYCVEGQLVRAEFNTMVMASKRHGAGHSWRCATSNPEKSKPHN